MKRKNLTRNALFTSVLSLLLCVSMLVGTTFAWFTDEVESGMNTIAAGNLDVELYYQVEGQSDWTKVDASTNVFMKDALWEPGHTEVVKLKVVNEGSLALNYQLGVNVASETEGTRYNKEIGKDETFKLSDYIKFGIVDGAQTYTREQAVAAVDATATALKTAYNSEAIALLPKTATNADNEDIVTMVVYMPTTVGNEANHKTGTTAPVINLGINLFATQQMSESDSFGSDYDALGQGAYASDAAPAAGETKEYPLYARDTSGAVTDIKVGTMRINSDSVEDSNKPIEISIIPIDQDKNVTVTADQKAQSYDITVSNIKEGNTTPIEVNLLVGTGKSGVKLYHKGVRVNGAEYNTNTGYVVFKTLSFSPFTVVFNTEVVADSGTWGGIDWKLHHDGTLIIAPTDGEPVPDKNAPTKRTYKVGEWRETVVYKSNGSASAIGGAPYDMKAVKKLIIEEGVTKIGSFTCQFPNLTGTVVIPSTVTYIGQEAFHKTPITELIFAEGGSAPLCIANGAFKKIQIEEVAFPGDREYIHIHHWAFGGSPNLKSAYIPANVTKSWGGEHVDYFDNFNSQTNVTWSQYGSIFTGCTKMETITFENEAVRDLFFAEKRQNTKEDYIVAYAGLTAYNSVEAAQAAAKDGEEVVSLK